VLQLIWPDYLWLDLYRVLVAFCLFFMLLISFGQFLMLVGEPFLGKQRNLTKTFKNVFPVRLLAIVMISWLTGDPWAWWLTVGVVILSMGVRWRSLKQINQS
jgi:hypothetical protein